MDILIENINASKFNLELNTLLWNQYSKKHIKSFAIFYGTGLLFFIMGLTTFSDFNTSTYMGKTTNYTNWHLSESFGFVIIIITTYMLVLFLRSKTKYFKKIKESAEKHMKGDNKIIIQINENLVTYKSSLMSNEIKWTMFTHYTTLNNYILLYTDEYFMSCVSIDKNLLNQSDITTLLDIVKKRLPYKPS